MARYPLFQTCASFALLLAASVMASASPVDLPDVTVQAHVVEELTHQLVTLILEELMTPASGFQPALELVEHHSGRGYRLTCQKVSPP